MNYSLKIFLCFLYILHRLYFKLQVNVYVYSHTFMFALDRNATAFTFLPTIVCLCHFCAGFISLEQVGG